MELRSVVPKMLHEFILHLCHLLCFLFLVRDSKGLSFVVAINRQDFIHGLGIAILSTSKGVITGKQAKQMNVGGEVLCYVY